MLRLEQLALTRSAGLKALAHAWRLCSRFAESSE